MEFLSVMKIGVALSVSLIIGLLLTAYAGVCLVMTVGSLFFWDLNVSFKKQMWLTRIVWLLVLLPFSLAVFFFIVPYTKQFILYVWSFV